MGEKKEIHSRQKVDVSLQHFLVLARNTDVVLPYRQPFPAATAIHGSHHLGGVLVSHVKKHCSILKATLIFKGIPVTVITYWPL